MSLRYFEDYSEIIMHNKNSFLEYHNYIYCIKKEKKPFKLIALFYIGGLGHGYMYWEL